MCPLTPARILSLLGEQPHHPVPAPALALHRIPIGPALWQVSRILLRPSCRPIRT